MNCRDFHRKCNELLDAEATPEGRRGGGGPLSSRSPDRLAIDDGDEALRAHAAGCDACRQLAARYHVLRHALRAWRRPPQPSPDLTDRILAQASAPARSGWAVVTGPARWPLPWRLVASFAAAAMIAAALLLPVIHPLVRSHRPERAPAVGPVASKDAGPDRHSGSGLESGRNDHRGFQLALAEATSATWDLARSASEPAARISRDMLDASLQAQDVRSEPRLGPAEPGVAAPVSIVMPQAPDAATASAVLQQVGDQVAAGFRPLSSTARQAFGFLLGAGPDQPGPRAKPPIAKGA